MTEETKSFQVLPDGQPVFIYSNAEGVPIRLERVDATDPMVAVLLKQLGGLVPLKDRRLLDMGDKQVRLLEDQAKKIEQLEADLQLIKDQTVDAVIYSFRHPGKNEIKIGRDRDKDAFFNRKRTHESKGFVFVDCCVGTELKEHRVKEALKGHDRSREDHLFTPLASSYEYFRISEPIIKELKWLGWPLGNDPLNWWLSEYQGELAGLS
jgi:hypothetical protein